MEDLGSVICITDGVVLSDSIDIPERAGGGAVKLRMTHRQLSGGVLSITEEARSNDNLLYPWTDLLSPTVRGRCFT